MLWAYSAVAVIGVLLGLRFRVSAVAAATFVVIAGVLAAASLWDWPLGKTLLVAVSLSVILHVAYLMGVSFGRGRGNRPDP